MNMILYILTIDNDDEEDIYEYYYSDNDYDDDGLQLQLFREHCEEKNHTFRSNKR